MLRKSARRRNEQNSPRGQSVAFVSWVEPTDLNSPEIELQLTKPRCEIGLAQRFGPQRFLHGAVLDETETEDVNSDGQGACR